jgi:uncharacterized membrane protein (UPF0127 family)
MIEIRNVTTGAIVAENASLAESFGAKFRGWMLRGRPASGEALVIQPCSSIHMMFMRFAIDAAFFDRELRVTRVHRHVRPWVGLAFGGRGSHGVIELADGAALSLKPGDQLAFGDAPA